MATLLSARGEIVYAGLTTPWHHASMSFETPALSPDADPDADGLAAMRAALRDLRVSLKRPAEHPYRDQALVILRDAAVRIMRINGYD